MRICKFNVVYTTLCSYKVNSFTHGIISQPRPMLVNVMSKLLRRQANNLRCFSSSAHGNSTHTDHHHPEDVDEEGNPYNEMEALPFGRIEGQPEQPDWSRRIFVTGYIGGLAVFLYLHYYKPDVSMEAWALTEAQQRMRERGVDMFWYDPEKYKRIHE